jgi:predicted nucleotide-binding protein (sugar kinase/HSP70/actin superfamily)
MGEFESLKTNIGQFRVTGETVLMPDMSHAGSLLVAAILRSYGFDARVMETCKDMRLGRQYTSGKECFPCQITLGDVLYHLKREKERLGAAFKPENYVYFMAQANGPCRFGMYNKLHRIVLDSVDGFSKIRIATLSSNDSYALGELMEPEVRTHFWRSVYVGIVIGDVLDRMLWRTRPYEKKQGLAEKHFEKALSIMCQAMETYGRRKKFRRLLSILEEVIAKARDIVDPAIAPKPLIGMVGEIYLRSHRQSNQDLIKLLESHGAEIVNASIAEWVNYVSYDNMRKARREIGFGIRHRNLRAIWKNLRNWLSNRIELSYQYFRMGQVYRRVRKHLPIEPDHRISRIEKQLISKRLFSFHVGTEAGLSIGGALENCLNGYDGIVNVFPFTCMPGTMGSAILKPILDRKKIPYIDCIYDETVQPNLEATVRTFTYQAAQHQRQRSAS